MANEFGSQFTSGGELSADLSPQLSAELDAQGNPISALGHIELDTTPADTSYVEGKLYYDNTEKTVIIRNDNSDVSLNVGSEVMMRVYNDSGGTINEGEAVYETGALANFPTIA